MNRIAQLMRFLLGASFLCLAVSASAIPPRTFSRQQMDQLRVQQQRAVAPAEIVGIDQRKLAPLERDALTLRPNEWIKTTLPSRTFEVDGRRRIELGPRFTGFDHSNRRVIQLIPVLEVEQKAMRLAADGIQFAATLRVGLDDAATPTKTDTLAASTILSLAADRASVDQADVTIVHTGTPYTRIQLTSIAPGDSVEVTLSFHKDKMHATIAVERPKIWVKGVPPGGLPGLGVGVAPLTVYLSDDAGDRERDVALTFAPGTIDPMIVTVSAAKKAVVRVRSAGLGAAALLTASGSGLVDNNTEVPITFPTAFFLAALIGGGLGSLFARLTRPNRTRKALVRHFAAGLILGLIGAGLYILGVNVTGVPLPMVNAELAVAVVAALVSIGGVKLLKLSKGLGASLEPEKGG